jgi:hypothetical protein
LPIIAIPNRQPKFFPHFQLRLLDDLRFFQLLPDFDFSSFCPLVPRHLFDTFDQLNRLLRGRALAFRFGQNQLPTIFAYSKDFTSMDYFWRSRGL